ncbi:MAG: glycosyltransferase [Oscillospiraceae bacterium]
MVLSIGMIVKNEEKYLERCLSALVPILENVDSELIIADTGSTDNTVEIAKKFTDKVCYFEWINDFSAARNFTMQQSQGDWFMFIDADEILQDASDIIHFFHSGEYLKYGSATYIQRSYTDMAHMDKYADFRALRLTKRFDDVAFVNPIHEAITPLHKPVKFLDAIVDHYGYMFRNDKGVTEDAKEKSNRNLPLLLKQLDSLNEGEVPEFSVYTEIADCYEIIDDLENALKYLRIGLDVLDHSCIAICAYYSHACVLLLNMERYDETIELCNDYFSPKNSSRKGDLATDISIYAIRGDAYFRLDRYKESIDDMISFFKVYRKFTNNRLNTEDLLYGDVKVKNSNLKSIGFIFLHSCIKEKRYNTANDYMKWFPIEEFLNDREYVFKYLHLRNSIMENSNFDGMPALYSQLDDYNKTQYERIIRWSLFKSDKRDSILKNLPYISKSSPKIAELSDIYNDFFGKNKADAGKIEHFISAYGTEFNTDILCVMMSANMDITPFITAPDFNVKDSIHALFDDYKDYQTALAEYDTNKISPQGLAKAAEVYGRAMVESQKQKKDISKLFREYGKIGSRWLSEFENEENIPADIRAASIAYSITSAQDSKDYKLCINEMRRLIKTFPEFAPIVKEYQEVIKKEIRPVQSENSKLAEMAAVVKANIRNMISSGNLSAAQNTLTELEKLCPGDPDIGKLKNDIANAAN